MLKIDVKYISWIISACLSWCSLNTSIAQNPVFKSFDIRTENSRPRIIKLFCDHNGLIWAGTDKGIFTFDGINFSKILNSDSLNAAVSCFFEDKTHTLWVGFENGKIIGIKNQKIIPFTPEEGLPKVPISCITEDSENRIYISTKGEGVYCIENKILYNINHQDGLSDDYCYDMVKLPDQRMCIATDAGLNFVKFINGKKTIQQFGTQDGLPDDIVRTLDIKNDILWIGMQENGIAKFDLKKNKLDTFLLKKSWEYGQINNLLLVDDNLYAATEDKGVLVIDRAGFSNMLILNDERSIKSNDLIIDQENNLWIAETIHMHRTSGNKISFISKIQNKQLDFIHCITTDSKGNLWFSPDQQLGHIFKGEDGQLKYEEYKILDGKIDIVTLYFDTYGFLWIGTMGAGVFRFNPVNGHVRKVTETTTTESSSILSINGKDNYVWVAGFNSVMKFEIRENGNSEDASIIKQNVFSGSKLLNDYVYTVFIDSKERTWFGTDVSGVYYYDGITLKNIPVSENAVYSFTEDKKGRIWFSTADAGILYMDLDQRIKKFQAKEGLSDPSPTSLLCTKTGNIIIVYSNGFDIINPDTKNIIYHSSEENLADINCDLNSITISSDSIVWIGTERGIIRYRPASDMILEKPKIVIQSVSVFHETIDFKNQAIFDYDENNLRFDYDGLWYIDPQRTNYSFFLEGYSAKWEITKDNMVSFPKLSPGNYIFRVKASLNGNFDTAQEAAYEFEIAPPLWQRWWFRIIVAGLLAVLILYIIRRREKQLRNFERLKREKVEFQFETLKSQVNPHFLFNSFNTLISVIESDPKNAVEYVEKLSEFFRSIVTYRDKNLITVSEELSLLKNYIFIQKKRFGDNLKLEISLQDETKNGYCIAPLTMQLLTENAIKHNAVSKESPLIISITSYNEKIKITNTINPKLAKEKSAGFGLQNIKSRYALLTDEKFEIITEENVFTVIIPLIKLSHEYTDR